MTASNSGCSQQPQTGSQTSLSPSEALAELSKQAKRLQRVAQYGRKADAIPILRRLIRTQVISHLTLPALYRQRVQVQRKHLYRLLAKEAGFDSWETWRVDLKSKIEAGDELELGLLYSPMKNSYPNLWFASVEEASRYTAEHGGQIHRYGEQAVVLALGPSK
jgi:hypothetical protein